MTKPNTLNLTWDNHPGVYHISHVNCFIPGFTYDRTSSYVEVYRPDGYDKTKGCFYTKNEWILHFYFEGLWKGPEPAAHLGNSDFNIQPGVTDEEMVAAVEKITPEELARVLTAKGWKPDVK